MFNNHIRNYIVFMFVDLVVISLLYFVEKQVFLSFNFMIIFIIIIIITHTDV